MGFELDYLKDYDNLIFDFDGTLINSEPYHKLAHSMILSYILKKDITLTKDEYAKYSGKQDSEIFEMYKKEFNIDFDTDQMATKKAEISRDLILNEDLKVFDYFYDIIKNKGDKHFYIVSNCHEVGLFSILESKGIIKYFDEIFCLPLKNISKAQFYKNIDKYIPNSQKTIVFEDNANVLQMLTKLGYTTVAIQNDMNYKSIEGKFTNIIKV